jgi:hypothetical protein
MGKLIGVSMILVVILTIYSSVSTLSKINDGRIKIVVNQIVVPQPVSKTLLIAENN